MKPIRAVLVLLVLAVVALAPTAEAGKFTFRGTVTRVVDGDTLDVRLTSGTRTRVRLIGIDTPERGACYAAKATSRARTLALGDRVVLRGDPTQDTRDRFGRLLAYVSLPGGSDLGLQLIRGGFGEVFVFERPFRRLGAYRSAEQAARSAGLGLWGACVAPSPPPPPPPLEPPPAEPPPAPPPPADCHPNYSPCLPIVSDLDCGEIPDSLKPIMVIGSDPYRLDGDNDGLGCE